MFSLSVQVSGLGNANTRNWQSCKDVAALFISGVSTACFYLAIKLIIDHVD